MPVVDVDYFDVFGSQGIPNQCRIPIRMSCTEMVRYEYTYCYSPRRLIKTGGSLILKGNLLYFKTLLKATGQKKYVVLVILSNLKNHLILHDIKHLRFLLIFIIILSFQWLDIGLIVLKWCFYCGWLERLLSDSLLCRDSPTLAMSSPPSEGKQCMPKAFGNESRWHTFESLPFEEKHDIKHL